MILLVIVILSCRGRAQISSVERVGSDGPRTEESGAVTKSVILVSVETESGLTATIKDSSTIERLVVAIPSPLPGSTSGFYTFRFDFSDGTFTVMTGDTKDLGIMPSIVREALLYPENVAASVGRSRVSLEVEDEGQSYWLDEDQVKELTRIISKAQPQDPDTIVTQRYPGFALQVVAPSFKSQSLPKNLISLRSPEYISVSGPFEVMTYRVSQDLWNLCMQIADSR